MAKKKTILSDSFEQVAELGKTTVKKTAKTLKDIVQDVGTAKSLEKLIDGNGSTSAEKTNGQNHTPLDLDKLKENYDEQDKQRMKTLTAHLFQLSKQEEAKVNVERKQKEQQKLQQDVSEEQEKKRREEEKKKQEEQGPPLPSGKKRSSIFSTKKKADEQHMETRPSTGKQ